MFAADLWNTTFGGYQHRDFGHEQKIVLSTITHTKNSLVTSSLKTLAYSKEISNESKSAIKHLTIHVPIFESTLGCVRNCSPVDVGRSHAGTESNRTLTRSIA